MRLSKGYRVDMDVAGRVFFAAVKHDGRWLPIGYYDTEAEARAAVRWHRLCR